MSIKVKRNGAWVEVYGGANNEEGIGTKNFVIPIEHSLDNDSNDVYTLGETYSYSDLIAAIDDGNEISCRITSKQSGSVILLPLIEYDMRADHFKFSGLYNEQLITVTITNINDDVLVEYINPNVNADWNQNDATQPSYIENRTHWIEPVDFEWRGEPLFNSDMLVNIPEGNIYLFECATTDKDFNVCTLSWRGSSWVVPVNKSKWSTFTPDSWVSFGPGSVSVLLHLGTLYLCSKSISMSGIGMSISDCGVVNYLPAVYIPSTIARLEDVVTSVNGQKGAVTIDIPEGVPDYTTSDNEKVLSVVDGAVAWKTVAWKATTIPDWNQNDATQPDYIKNRTHYDAGIADFTPSGSWTLSSSVTGLPSGMATGCFAGEFEVESDKIVPISYDIGPMFGSNRTNVRIGEVIHNTTGPTFDFCVNATYAGGGQWKLFFYTSDGTLYGNTPTISNIKIGVQLDKKYLPMNDIVSEVKNATGVLPVESGGTGYSSIRDTKYTIPRYRASSLHSSETTPTTNGVICWTYE